MLDLANLIILIATAAIILWYTVETFKLRKDAQATSRARLTPIPALIFHATEMHHKVIDDDIDVDNRDILITNIGLSPVLNIKFDIIRDLHEEENNPILFRLVESNILMPNEVKALAITVPLDDNPSGRLRGSYPHPYLIPGMARDENGRASFDTPAERTHWSTHTYGVRITYENPYGEKFETRLIIDKDGSHTVNLSRL